MLVLQRKLMYIKWIVKAMIVLQRNPENTEKVHVHLVNREDYGSIAMIFR